MALRPYWSGQIRLSLVSLPVNIYAALNRSRQIALHEIYRKTGERIHHQNVAGDKEVEREDIIKGYEVEKGEYVMIEPDEIAKLKVPSKKVLYIVQFVNADEIDPIYNESPYFVAPQDAKGEDAFTTIRDALRQSGKVGIGQLSIGGRERLCSIKPCGSGILLETLRYEDEIRASDPYFSDISKSPVDKEQLALAKELIKRKTTKFKPGQFHDHYREALQELIDSKIEHRKPQAIREEKSSGKVINLMDALRKSLREPGNDTKKSKQKSKPLKTKARTKKTAARRKAS
jgi:DNA end-binding protein Ku